MTERKVWFLKGELKDNSPWIIPINKQDFSIGRLDTNDMILLSQGVSRQHARIVKDGNDLYIMDLDSKNGIMVNGLRIKQRALLREGDIVGIGSSEFILSTEESDAGLDRTLLKSDESTQFSFADMYGLSEREYEVLFFLIKGHSVKQIGESLFISPGTAKNHVLKIYKKTGCHTRIEIANLFNRFKGKK